MVNGMARCDQAVNRKSRNLENALNFILRNTVLMTGVARCAKTIGQNAQNIRTQEQTQ